MIKHHFSAGVYVREMTLEADHNVETHEHVYDHFGILGSGSVIVDLDGEMTVHHGPCVIEILAGKKHSIRAISDITWFCVHATDVADPEKIDEVLIVR
jgi:mannose-6-phosphate isomerase-like protein (cupin superfamily)